MRDVSRIIELLDHTDRVSVAVIGDFCLDKYLYIDPARDELSVETGLTAYQVDHKYIAAGAGGTITNNLCAIGVHTVCIGLIGEDGEGAELLKALRSVGADTSHMVSDESVCTNTYTKPMRLTEDGSYHEMNRLDFRNFVPPSKELTDRMIGELESVLDDIDAVIVIDQFFQRNAGAVTDYFRARINALAGARRDRIFFADSRAFISEFENMIIKCNQYELMKLGGNEDGDPENMEDVIRYGETLEKKSGIPVFVTCGADGMIVFSDAGAEKVPAFQVKGEIDICGAGDATSAGIVTGLSLGLGEAEAALLAAAISSITIQQIGKTGTASVPEVRERLLRGENADG